MSPNTLICAADCWLERSANRTVVTGVGVEGRIEVDKIDRFVGDVAANEVVAVERDVARQLGHPGGISLVHLEAGLRSVDRTMPEEINRIVADGLAAGAMLTDSGGVQEETTYLGLPCFTLRDSTERPVTVRAVTNTLLGLVPERIAGIPAALINRRGATVGSPALWDGRAAIRAAEALAPHGGATATVELAAGAAPPAYCL